MRKNRRFGGVGYATPDAKNQPPRFYSAFVSGGFVANLELARSLKAQGFEVAEIDLMPSELAWLQQHGPDLVGDRVFLARCPTNVYLDANGSRVCGFAVQDLEEVSEAMATSLGVTEKDYAPLTKWVDPSKVKLRFFASKRAPTSLEEDLAAKRVKEYDQLAANEEALRPVVNLLGDKLPSEVLGPYLQGVQVLVEFAQPVAEFKRTHQQGSTNRMSRFGMHPAVIAGIVLAALIIVGTSASIVMAKAVKVSQANAGMWVAREESDRIILEMIKDPATDPGTREGLVLLLRERAKNPPPPAPDPLASIAAIAKVAVPVMAVGAILWFGGPVLKEAGAAIGQKIRSFRQSRKAIAQAG
jgi:hypothetical protein